jgi:NCS1 family nucleobase:cation symporter-1
MLLTIAPCVPFVFWPHELYDLGDAFLAYNGTMYAPIVGIFFVDFFVLRRQQLSLWSIFEADPSGAYHYHHGFHWPALASLVLGQALYLFLYNPISGETHESFRIMPASVAACVVPALTYWLATRVMRRSATADRNAPQRLIAPNL